MCSIFIVRKVRKDLFGREASFDKIGKIKLPDKIELLLGEVEELLVAAQVAHPVLPASLLNRSHRA
jgi:hypothetical protein